MRKVYVYQRRTFNWSETDWDQFSSSKNDEKEIEFFRRRIEVWNKALSVDYFSFRQELKKISLSNLERVAPLVSEKDLEKVGDDDLLVPTDDDDWLPPGVAGKLTEVESDLTIWDQAWLRNNAFGVFHAVARDLKDRCTNNYALTKRASDHLSRECHWHASDLFRNSAHVKVDAFSFTVKSPASWSVMHQWSDAESVRDQMTLFAENEWLFPFVPIWTVPYLRLVSELSRRSLREPRIFL